MIRFAFVLLLCAALLGPIVLAVAAMEGAPAVPGRLTSTARDVERARDIYRQTHALTKTGRRGASLSLSEADINSLIAVAARGLPFLRGRAEVKPDGVRVAMAADATSIPGGGWLNLRVTVRPSETGLDLAQMRLGRLDLPPGLVLPMLGRALDLWLGDGAGRLATGGIDGVAIRGEVAVLGIGLDAAAREALARRAGEGARTLAGIGSSEDVRVYDLAIREAAAERELPKRGSVLPYLGFALDLARRRGAEGDRRAEARAAFMALAIHCGHRRFESLIGKVAPETAKRRRSGCEGTTLGGRVDLRRHFVLSAGLEVAGDAGIAFAVGELKELLDSNRGGSGFSFDDLAADRAGIRLAAAFVEADDARRALMVEIMASEDAILPSLAGLPVHLTEAEFARRFGDVDSDAYRDLVAEIDRRIDGLAVFAVP